MTHAPLPDKSNLFAPSQQQQEYLQEELNWLLARLAKTRGRPDDPILLNHLHSLERLRLFDSDELASESAAYIVHEVEYLALAQAYSVTGDVASKVSSGTLPYAKAIRGGVLNELKLWFENYNTSGERHPLSMAGPVMVGEVHCPLVEGATGQLTVSSTKEQNIGLEISVAGFGGGGWTKEVHFTNSSTVPVSAGHCVALLAHLSGSFSAWTHLDTGKQILLVSVTGIGSIYGKELSSRPDYEPAAHFCLQTATYPAFLKAVTDGRLSIGRDYDRVSPSSGDPKAEYPEFSSKWATSREYHIKADIGGEDWDMPVGACIEGTSRFIEEVEVTLNLPPNHDYIGRYASARHLPQHWAAHPDGADG